MAQSFTKIQWKKIHDLMDARGEKFGLPVRRSGSVVMGSFNIRKMGAVEKKSEGAWLMIEKIAKRFDLLAIQEVQDNLEGLRTIKKRLGGDWGMTASDITGSYPGNSPPPERLAFLYRWKSVERTEIASDITYDRSEVVATLHKHRKAFKKAFDDHARRLEEWAVETAARKAQGKKRRAKPVPHLPEFITFIRQPMCVSFEVAGAAGARPYRFLAVNAHLLYGKYLDERRKEFSALVGWLVDRARNARRMYYPNVILFGDCNLDFDDPVKDRSRIDKALKGRNKDALSHASHANLNFPFLDVHPGRTDPFRSNARHNQTYDQIGIIGHDKRLPDFTANKTAGQGGKNGFDYGMFDFVDLIATALHGKATDKLTKKQLKILYAKFEHDLSDHMPIWIRLKKPG